MGLPFILNCSDGEIINVRLYEALEKKIHWLRYPKLSVHGHHYLDKMFTNRHVERKILKEGKTALFNCSVRRPTSRNRGKESGVSTGPFMAHSS